MVACTLFRQLLRQEQDVRFAEQTYAFLGSLLERPTLEVNKVHHNEGKNRCEDENVKDDLPNGVFSDLIDKTRQHHRQMDKPSPPEGMF
jgi:hypothetical protein